MTNLKIKTLLAVAVIIPGIATATDPMPCDQYAETARQNLQARYESQPLDLASMQELMADNVMRRIITNAYAEPLVQDQTLGLDDFGAKMFYQCLSNKV